MLFAVCHKRAFRLIWIGKKYKTVRLVMIHLKQGSVKLVFLDEILV